MDIIGGVIDPREISPDHKSGDDSCGYDSIEEQRSLSLIRKLCKTLDAEGIVYCHWKSTATLDRSATGKNDLDLLVSHADVQRFIAMLCRLGFREACVTTAQQVPGVLSYYGYDNEADRFVHVHAYHQLILSHDMTKNYRLPIEGPFLESVIRDGLFKIPAPEFELIVYVIRMVLKHSTWDSILGFEGGLSTTEQKELQYLTSRADQTRLFDIVKQNLPFVNKALFSDCMRSLRPGSPIWTRIKAGHQLQSRLRAHARGSQILDVFLKLWRRGIWGIRRHIFRHSPKKRLANGGAIIALVGGHGAGKTTAVDELHRWLSKDFQTIKLYMGKPTWSWTTFVVRGILKIGRSLDLYPYKRSPAQQMLDQNPYVFPGYPWLLREICTAHDRCLTYVKARRFANNGGIVICDRFPLPRIKLMDGFRFDLVIDVAQTNRLIEFLVRACEKYYQQIMLPELLIVLRVDPEIAVQRKADEREESVRARSTEIWELNWLRTPAHVLDANKSQPDVLSEIKALIWSHL